MSESIEKIATLSVSEEIIELAYTILDDHLEDPSEVYLSRPFSRLEGLYAIDPDAYATSFDCPMLYTSVELGESTLKGERAYIQVGRQTNPYDNISVFVDVEGVRAMRGSFTSMTEAVELDNEQAQTLLCELHELKGMLVKRS